MGEGEVQENVEEILSKITEEQIEQELRKFIVAETVESFTLKTARSRLEEHLSLPEGTMKSRKEDIKKCIQKVVDSVQQLNADNKDKGGDEDAGETQNNERETDAPATKKQRVAEEVEEAPKDAAKIQAKLMTRTDFEKDAEEVACELGPSKFSLEPRVFSANSKGQSNVGWGYYKKVKMPVGDKLVWCTVSMSVIVAGSRDWQDGDKAGGRSN
eukprot:GHVS01010267.1.p1 GENE.GHVS01010267.1~~GHVS01010267.1.p1  ORF type:complete len:214 (-),score=49.35 GHVS01010267.1:320-961(-)